MRIQNDAWTCIILVAKTTKGSTSFGLWLGEFWARRIMIQTVESVKSQLHRIQKIDSLCRSCKGNV